MPVKDNWASRPHCPPGDHEAQSIHKAVASGFVLPKPTRKTVPPGLEGSSTGGVGTDGWFHTAKK